MNAWCRRLTTTCLISFALSTAGYGQARPLTAEELRETATNLNELAAAREKIRAQEQRAAELDELAERERAVAARELETERRMTAVAERERDAEKRRADELDKLLTQRNRKPSIGCRVLRAITLGMARCG